MTKSNYDNIISKIIEEETIDYGILYGNKKIVFIKTGASGNIRGYQDKYLRMAHRVHERLGATVICASNPDTEGSHEDIDSKMIMEVAAKRGFAEYEVCFVGTSDGGYQNLALAKRIPQTTSLLGINTSLIDDEDLIDRLQAIPDVRKTLVFGTNDEDYASLSTLNLLDCEKLEIKTVEGADHDFTGMVEKFISLIDLVK